MSSVSDIAIIKIRGNFCYVPSDYLKPNFKNRFLICDPWNNFLRNETEKKLENILQKSYKKYD